MPENKTALAGLAIFKDALVALKSKIVQEDTPQGAYEFKDEKITQGKRQKANNEALALLREFQLDPSRKATEAEKVILSRYTGKGGGLVVDGVKGSQYEYYTPLPLANHLWQLLKEQGFDGGAVLDPCAGTGIFAAGRPENVVMQSVELNDVSGAINGLVNDQENHNTIISPFEKIAAQTQDNTYDAVITNVPFGSKQDRGDNARHDVYADDDLDSYFVKRSIDKLKYGKLAVFIAHPKLLTGTQHKKFRQYISLRAELVGAYRLPNSIFKSTGADVVTDILVFRKHSEELTEKIDNLYQNGAMSVLQESRVLDADIISGKYYKTEGVKHVLGESKIVQHAKFKTDVETVINNDSLANILKLIRRFPDSRINRELLDATELKAELPIADGDLRVIGGTTYEYNGGKWVAIETAKAFEKASYFESALAAFNAGMTYADLTEYKSYCVSARYNMEAWADQLLSVVQGTSVELYGQWLVHFALYQALQTDVSQSYAQAFPDLTGAMKQIALQGGSKLKHKSMRTILTYNAKAFDKKAADGIAPYWYGQGIDIALALDAKGAYENAIYTGRAQDFRVSVDEIKQTDPSFDPLTNNEYAISGDGQFVTLNRDYYTGNHGQFLQRIDAEIEAATDPALRAKLIAQRKKSFEHVDYVDVANLDLGLRATNISMDVKSEFLGLYGGDDVYLDEDGKIRLKDKQEPLDRIISIMKRDKENGHKHRWVQTFFLNRILDSVNNNVRLTLKANKEEVSKEDHDLVFKAFLEYANELDATFSAYLKSNVGFMQEMEAKINDPMNKEMISELDTSPIEIQGFAPKFDGFKALQTYQNAEIRRLSRRFEGITGFDVGLGKTMTAIAAAINLHNIGVKKRTMFVVPSHTISKWYRDFTMTKDDVSDVLVIGSKENTQASANSANYGSDLNLLLSKPYRMVIITSDAFTMIPLKDATIENYYNGKAAKVDFSKDKDREKFNAFMAEKKEPLQKETGRLPFFEDLGVDSIVFDEAQMFKNGDASEGSGNFQTVKGLSLLAESQLSNRAISAKIKSEYVRRTNSLGDGVVLLSATPITNSPSEILTMLSLAVGERKAKNMLGGAAIDSVDDFLSTFAYTESITNTDMLGTFRSDETFTGFKNVELLKSVLHSVGNIQTARENDLKIPAQEDIKTNVELGDQDKMILSDMKRAYNLARSMKFGGMVDADDMRFLESIMSMLGEDETLIGHPFNLITKMQDIVLMGGEATLSRAMFIDFLPEDETTAQKVVDEFNKKPVKITGTRMFPMVSEDDTKLKKRGKNIGDADEYEFTIRAFMDADKNRIGVTANDTRAIGALMTLAEKAKLSLKPKLSAKVQAMIENFKTEMATPKHNGHAKQIIFCDTLAMHHVIKQALIEYCGVEKSRIAILNAATRPDGSNGKVRTEDVQDIQDNFATDKYTVVIANKKADTGIDLQRGTQAIHHLTTGWTPDSLQQRNGRGVRQGNQQEKVNVYLYNANGTFDEYKLHVINGKSDWIDQLMNKDTAVKGTLHVSSELTDDDYDLMIQADSQEAIADLLKQRDEREAAARRDRSIKHLKLLTAIAQKAESQANVTKVDVAIDNLLRDYQNYVNLIRRDKKATDDAEREQIKREKASLIQQYDDHIANNTIENWDRSFARKAEEKGRVSYYVSSIGYGDFGKEVNQKWVENLLESDSSLSKRFNGSYESLQRMAQSTKDQLLKYADSPYSEDERRMLIDKTAVITDDGLHKHGDLLKAEGSSGAVVYGMRVVSEGRDSYKFTESTVRNIEPIQPSERAAAIDAMVQSEIALLTRNEVFSYAELNESSRNSSSRFSRVYPEIQERVEQALKVHRDEWINGESEFAVLTLRYKGSPYVYWYSGYFKEIYEDNPEIAKEYNANFEGIINRVERGGGGFYAYISNNNVHLVERVQNRALLALIDDIFLYALSVNKPLNLSRADSMVISEFYQEYGPKLRKVFADYLSGGIERLYPIETVLTDAQKNEIALHIAQIAWGNLATDYTPFVEKIASERMFESIIKLYALDESSPEGIAKQHTKLHTDMGRYKNQKLHGVAFLATGDFGSAFRARYKDVMKDYATSKRLKYIWDNRNSRWVVDTDLMVWMMKQDWFKLNEVEFF